MTTERVSHLKHAYFPPLLLERLRRRGNAQQGNNQGFQIIVDLIPDHVSHFVLASRVKQDQELFQRNSSLEHFDRLLSHVEWPGKAQGYTNQGSGSRGFLAISDIESSVASKKGSRPDRNMILSNALHHARKTRANWPDHFACTVAR